MPNNIIKSFADKSGKTENEVEKLWNELKAEYKDDYEKITGTLKKILKIDEASKGTYVARKIKNAESLYNHYKNQGVDVVPMEELHCTIAYSKKEFKPELNSNEIEIMYDEDIYPYLEPLGDDGCIVMKFKSKEMTERWQDCIDRGATYDYEKYIPHITIAINEKDLDLKSIRKPDFNIILSDEYTEELDLNWKDKLTVNDLLESTNIKSIKEKFKDYFKKINIYEYDDKVSIDLIISNEKNSGYGTKLMNEIVDYCDKTDKTIILTPSDEFGGNKKRLIEFYKRFGFLENKGKNKIFGIFESMYRLPKNKTNEGLNMRVEKLVESLSKLKLNFVTKAMIAEKVESLDEAKLNEYLESFEEYKNSIMESEKFAELVEGKEVDTLSEKEIEDLIEKCSEEDEDLLESLDYKNLSNESKVKFDKLITLVNGKLKEIKSNQDSQAKIQQKVNKELKSIFNKEYKDMSDDDFEEYSEEEESLLIKNGYYKINIDWNGLGDIIYTNLNSIPELSDKMSDLLKAMKQPHLKLKAISKIAFLLNKASKSPVKVRFLFENESLEEAVKLEDVEDLLGKGKAHGRYTKFTLKDGTYVLYHPTIGLEYRAKDDSLLPHNWKTVKAMKKELVMAGMLKESLEENYIGKAMIEVSKGNTGSAIDNFKSAMLQTLSKNETYKEIDSKMSLYVNEVEIYKATFTDTMGNKKIIKSDGSIVNTNNIPKSITDINYLVNKSDVEKETGNTGTKQYKLYLNKRILQAVSKSKNNATFAKELNNIFKTKVFNPE